MDAPFVSVGKKLTLPEINISFRQRCLVRVQIGYLVVARINVITLFVHWPSRKNCATVYPLRVHFSTLAPSV